MSSSILARALLALLLMIGFYLLALAISAGLLYIPYAEFKYANRLHIKLAILCIFGGLAILWSVLPRIDRFKAPGPRLTPERHPRLFQEIQAVADSVKQAMPAEVFLVADVNAWVSQRGGLMGFGSRRVMGLGLPLMRVLTRSQLKAVLAHEFGHYYGGDTRLGPWIYKTRGAIGRTIAALRGDGRGSVLQLPFLWYGKMFLRITHAVSRRQEFLADELAARAVGSRPLMDGLRAVHGMAPAYAAYWRNECAPVLQAGFHPPLVEGFQQFITTDPIAQQIVKHVEEELQSGKSDPYDTHPPLKDRIAAITHLPAGDSGADDPPAITLLEGVTALENELLLAMAGPEAASKLKHIGWSEVCTAVYLPQWKQLARANASALSGITPEALPQLAADLKSLGQRFVDWRGQRPDVENAPDLAGAVIGSALSVALAAKGAQFEAAPGSPFEVRLGAEQIRPFEIASELAKGALTQNQWQTKCASFGIVGADLGNLLPAGGPPPPPAG